MNKVCCVGDADICPKSSSCSMVLRSACSHHRHSRESSTVKELRAQTPSKSKHSSNTSKDTSSDTLHIESVLESSLKQLALKSAKRTYSLLKGGLYNHYEFSENDQKVYETSALNLSCAKELHFDYIDLSSDNSGFGNSLNYKECNSDYSSASESDINSSESMASTSNSSRSYLTRSSLNAMRSLSGSEGEDDISVQRVTRQRKSKSIAVASSLGLTGQNVNSHISNNHSSYIERHNDVNNHFNLYSGGSEINSQTHLSEPSHLDISTVQYSSRFDRFRWFLWRCTYLKIIRSINFDAWFLSRLHNYGKWCAIFFFLLPLLLYLCWDVIPYTPYRYQALTEHLHSAASYGSMVFSSVFSPLYNCFEQKEESVIASDIVIDTSHESNSQGIFSYLPSLGGFSMLSGWFAKAGESSYFNSEAKYKSKESTYQSREDEIKSAQSVQPSKEEIRLIAIEVLRDEINFVKELQKSENEQAEIYKLEKEQRLHDEIGSLRGEFQTVIGTMRKLEKEITKQNEKSQDRATVVTLTDEDKKHIDELNFKLKTIEAKLGVLEGLKGCCDKQWNKEDILLLLENNLSSAFKNVMEGDSNPNSKYYFFNQWLNSKFFSHEKLMKEINTALKRQTSHQESSVNYDNVIQVVESTVVKYVDNIKRNLSDLSSTGYFNIDKDIFSEDKIKKIVKEAIMLYDADKIGQVDYALESGGGSVLGTRCSETYVEKYGKLSILGVPLWTNSNSPRTAIQPDVQPGRCWAFKGSQGFLVLELSATIYPTGFTLEHIPVSLSPSGSVDSAPKNFSVWGLESEKDNRGNLLGEYWYDINGDPLQYFAVQKPSEKPYSYIELQVQSNHGNLEYTCLYRFRVHGKRVR